MNRNRIKTKQQGFGLAKKVWVCKQCSTWHVAKKPVHCNACGQDLFFYFASKHEAQRYHELEFMERAGMITDLETQVKYPIEINGKKICAYFADFRYKDSEGNIIIEDTKSDERGIDIVYKLKKKLVEAIYSIEITHIYMSKRKK